MLDLFLSFFAGILLGIIAGLIPGVHTNTLAALALALAPLLPFEPILLIIAILTLSITNTVIDSIPSTLVGAPESEKVLAALPAHRLVQQGRAQTAVRLTVAGSALSLIFGLLLAIPFGSAMAFAYPYVQPLTAWLLLITLGFLLWREYSDRIVCVAFLLFSGLLGWSILHIEQLNQPLFPLLSGMFGISLLWNSLGQKESSIRSATKEVFALKPTYAISAFAGTVAGSVAAFLPGLGPSQVAIVTQSCTPKSDDEHYLVLTGAISTANMFISLVTLYALDKARNGSIVVMQQLAQLDVATTALLFFVMIAAGGFAAIITIPLSQVFSQGVQAIGTMRATVGVIILIICMATYFDGTLGVITLIVSTLLGLAAERAGVPKHYLMGCLFIPVLIGFF